MTQAVRAQLACRRRRAAADRACFEIALRDAVRCGSRLRARRTARERFADGLCRAPGLPARYALWALFRVRADAWPRFGGGSLTPARRAFDRPMAIACFVERAPCLPSRMWWNSSLTNSPACVVGAFPSRLSFRARSKVFCSGIVPSSVEIKLPDGCTAIANSSFSF